MRTVSDGLREIIQGNPFLEFGIHYGLFNLSQLARYLRPFVEARTHKEVKATAIAMGLSRLQQSLRSSTRAPDHYVIDKVTIHSGLFTATFAASPEAHEHLNALYHRIQREGGFCSLAQGQREITVIAERRHQSRLDRILKQAPLYTHDRLASIGVQFGERYADVPGVLYMLLQRVALQNVNLIEISSTYTEIDFYVDEGDTRTVFDTLFRSFLVQGGPEPGWPPRPRGRGLSPGSPPVGRRG